MYYSENLNEPASSLADSLKQHDLDAIACVIVEIIILFFFVWGGGVDNVQFACIARYRLRIPRYLQALARIKLESSEVVVFDGGGILCGCP